MPGIDLRIVKVSVEVNGVFRVYEGLAITARGVKFANANANECEVTISNLDKSTQDYILSQTSPYNLNRTPKRIAIDAGRLSYGTTRVFTGEIFSSRPTQPPDIAVVLRCLSTGFESGNIIQTKQSYNVPLSSIAQQVSKDMGVTLDFQATDKNIPNYQYAGSASGQIEKLNSFGDYNAFVDNGDLVVLDAKKTRVGKTRVVNLNTGMIGIPEITERGVTVKFFVDKETSVGGSLALTSQVYPAANGNYKIFKLAFQISNRDVPFYYIADCQRNL